MISPGYKQSCHKVKLPKRFLTYQEARGWCDQAFSKEICPFCHQTMIFSAHILRRCDNCRYSINFRWARTERARHWFDDEDLFRWEVTRGNFTAHQDDPYRMYFKYNGSMRPTNIGKSHWIEPWLQLQRTLNQLVALERLDKIKYINNKRSPTQQNTGIQ